MAAESVLGFIFTTNFARQEMLANRHLLFTGAMVTTVLFSPTHHMVNPHPCCSWSQLTLTSFLSCAQTVLPFSNDLLTLSPFLQRYSTHTYTQSSTKHYILRHRPQLIFCDDRERIVLISGLPTSEILTTIVKTLECFGELNIKHLFYELLCLQTKTGWWNRTKNKMERKWL